MLGILLQTTIESDTATTVMGEAGEIKLSVIDLLVKGGWIMIPIIVLAIIGVYIFIERYSLIKRSTKIDDSFMNKIRDLVISGNIEGARSICNTTDSPVARMIEKGLSRIGNPLKDISISIENIGNLEVFKLEKKMSFLATIAGAAPMIGFLGTVTGMIQAFYDLSMAGGNNIDPLKLSEGIYEAMITTATGLAVGIIAYVGYNILTSMIKKAIFNMEAKTVEFIDVLHEPA
jgi:biopolymer transport protein ExbB